MRVERKREGIGEAKGRRREVKEGEEIAFYLCLFRVASTGSDCDNDNISIIIILIIIIIIKKIIITLMLLFILMIIMIILLRLKIIMIKTTIMKK